MSLLKVHSVYRIVPKGRLGVGRETGSAIHGSKGEAEQYRVTAEAK